MAQNPKFYGLLTQMAEMHDRKNADYSVGESNPYSNFEEAAAFAGCSVDTVFRVLIGIKGARLKALAAKGVNPVNESVADSQLDLAVYAALYSSYFQETAASKPSHTNIWVRQADAEMLEGKQ